MKLFYKILLVVLSGAAFAVVTVSYFSYRFGRTSLEDSIIHEQSQVTSQTLNQIDRTIYHSLLEIQNIAQEDLFEEALAFGGNSRAGILSKRLNEYTLTSGPWDILSILDKDGVIKSSTYKDEIGKSVIEFDNSAIAFETSKSGDIYYSDVTVSQRTGKPSVIFSAPIRDNDTPNKEIVGVVIGLYSWQSVVEVLENIPGYETELYNSTGVLIGTNNKERSDLVFDETITNNLDIDSYSGSTALGIIKERSSDKVLSTYASEEGYLSYKGNGWILVFQTPSDVAYSTARNTATKLAFVLGFLVLFSSIPTLLIIHKSISKPISDLTNAVKNISQGNLLRNVEVRSSDEIGQLATAFNIMVDKLQKSYFELEESLDKLTVKNRELDQKINEAHELNTLMVGRELKMVELKKEIEDLKNDISK